MMGSKMSKKGMKMDSMKKYKESEMDMKKPMMKKKSMSKKMMCK